MSLVSRSLRTLLLSASLSTCGLGLAEAGVAILTPLDGETKAADLCPFPVCTAHFPSLVQVTGAPLDYLEFVATLDGDPAITFPICQPPDPFDGRPGCQTPPVTVSTGLLLREGSWTVVARARRGALVEDSAPVRVTVLPSGQTPPGAITLSSVVPIEGAPSILARDPGPAYPNGIRTTPGETVITGTNLDNNPFLHVYVSPIRPFEPPLAAESGLPLGNWCRYPARILQRGAAAGGESFLRVELPELPLEAPTTCGVTPGPVGSIFAKDWRVLIEDRWIRPERRHDWLAIPTPQSLPWRDAPPFKMVKPAYPAIDGFGFVNKATDPKYKEFLTVFGNNAYICVGAFGVCPTRVPDPLYHLVWWPIYSLVIGGTGGSCNGLSATSLLMSREELQTEAFSPDVHYPVGFDQPGDPAAYSDPDWCTPFCSPPRPANLWAEVRMNHGVQFSREFLLEIVDTLGEAVFDPNDVGSIRGVPRATLDRVAANPRGYVLCFFAPGNGHCVTPYAVQGNRILIYDNNHPGDTTRYIEIVGDDYSYPARSDEPNGGNALVAFPIGIWKAGRHLFGVQDLVGVVQGDPVEFLFSIAVGSADMTVTNATGGRWGYQADGTFSDSLIGALSLPPLGPQAVESHAMPLLLAMNQPAPRVEVAAKGGRYLWSAGASGHILQLEASDAQAGDTDVLNVTHPGGSLAGFDFTPQRAASRFVPRVGLALGDQDRALFHFLGLSVPGGARVGFAADKQQRAVSFENDSGATTHHVLALDHVAGAAESHGRMLYGPFAVPDGARQRVRLASWPDVTRVVSELDVDRDGTPDYSEVVSGRPTTTPIGQDSAADVSVTKTVAPARVALREPATFTVTVQNAGPDTASEVVLFDALPGHASIQDVAATLGQCETSAAGLACQIGTLAPGDSATVTYVVTPRLPGALANGATVVASEGDPNLGNNAAFATLEVPVRVDVEPGERPNVVKVDSHGHVEVAILGQRGFDVRSIDASSLVFGPDAAPRDHDSCRHDRGRGGCDDRRPSSRHRHGDRRGRHHRECGRLADVNHDGRLDLVSSFRIDETGIEAGDTSACISGSFRDGRPLAGCDAIVAVGPPRRHGGKGGQPGSGPRDHSGH